MHRLSAACLLAMSIGLPGCGGGGKPPAEETTFKSDEHGDGHSHDRGKMKLVDVGPLHAGLTAHLSSKDGNELDIFIETVATDPKPEPLPLAKITAKAKRDGDNKEYTLEFEPAPMDERKDDPPGKCSHFVAKASWMKAEDKLTVTTFVAVKGKTHQVVWNEFNPRRYAHHED